MGVLEDVPVEPSSNGANSVEDTGPADVQDEKPLVARKDPVIVGAGRARSLSDVAKAQSTAPVDWSSVGRNDPCPCGSGKKFKKCHGASL